MTSSSLEDSSSPLDEDGGYGLAALPLDGGGFLFAAGLDAAAGGFFAAAGGGLLEEAG